MLPLIVAVLFLNSCGKNENPSKQSVKTPPTLRNSLFMEITPMADGSAYATSLTSGLWYLRGNKAVRVSIEENNSSDQPMFLEITPILDGGAYATTMGTNFTLWYIHEDHAEKVNEVKSLGELGTLPKISSKAFLTLYLAERGKRKSAEANSENPNDYAPDTADDARY